MQVAEILSLKRIKEHSGNCPYFPKYDGAYIDDKNLYLAMEICLFDLGYLRDNIVLSKYQVKFITTDVLFALKFLHSHNMFHRDIKDKNVLLGIDGFAKLTDFGISYCGKPPSEYDEMLDDIPCGSIPYMAYEKTQDFF
jgi:serine/threonine protein kinase